MTVGQLDDALLAELRERVVSGVSAWRPGAVVRDIQPLTGGASSLTFVVKLDGLAEDEGRLVLKVAPPGLEPVRNRDVLRQAKLQRALSGGDRVLAPEVLFEDEGRPPRHPPFMAMALVPGECVEPVLQVVDERPSRDVVRARYLDGARVLSALHGVVPADVGLGDEEISTLGAEIDRWTRAFETVPDELRGAYLRTAQALHATAPEPMTAVVTHGDYRLGNTLCDGDRITAIIDWEIWSLGDPRVDVTWYTYFTDDAEHPASEPGEPAGTPTQAEVVAAYEQAAGEKLRDMDWFHALTKYKEAAATALLLKRSMKDGRELSPATARMLPVLPCLVDEAREIVGG